MPTPTGTIMKQLVLNKRGEGLSMYTIIKTYEFLYGY